ncbi:fimbrial protein [Serratia aquatilis]|uniref:Fimbrial protein n=1 Tax=Serratia aquatilis TaxID=1737515 RepID=A0ABV6EK58_9GAMM
MRIFWKSFAFLLISCTSTLQAADVIFNITGIIKNASCSVSFGNNQTVPLGTFSTGYLNSVGKKTPLQPFMIKLDNCPNNYDDVQVTFEGDIDAGNPQLLALQPGGAQNVGVAIYDSDKTSLIPINTASSGKSVSTTQETTLTFYAAYQSTGTVTEGAANADVSFTVSYN